MRSRLFYDNPFISKFSEQNDNLEAARIPNSCHRIVVVCDRAVKDRQQSIGAYLQCSL